MQIIVLPGHIKVIGVAALTGKHRRTSIGADIKHILTNHLGNHSRGHIGENNAGQNLGFIPLDETFGNLPGLLRLAIIIIDQEIHGNTTQGSFALINSQLKTVTDILTQIPGLGRQGCNHADPDRFLGHSSDRITKSQQGH